MQVTKHPSKHQPIAQPLSHSLSHLLNHPKLSAMDKQVLQDVIGLLKQQGYRHIQPKRISYILEQSHPIYQGLCQAMHAEWGEVMIKWEYGKLPLASKQTALRQSGLSLHHEIAVLSQLEELGSGLNNGLSSDLGKDLDNDLNSCLLGNVVVPLEKGQRLDIDNRSADFFYMSLPFYRLGNLYQCVRYYQQQLTIHQLDSLKLALLVATAKAISQLHQAGWMHGDIKPSNVLVRGCQYIDGSWQVTVGLTDLALSHRIGEVEGVPPQTNIQNQLPIKQPTVSKVAAQSQQRIQGTPAYLAPECWQASDDKSGLSKGRDWYAYGVLFYEVLQGRRPFFSDFHHCSANYSNNSATNGTTTTTSKSTNIVISDGGQDSLMLAWAKLHRQQSIPMLATQFANYQMILDYLMSKKVPEREWGIALLLSFTKTKKSDN